MHGYPTQIPTRDISSSLRDGHVLNLDYLSQSQIMGTTRLWQRYQKNYTVEILFITFWRVSAKIPAGMA